MELPREKAADVQLQEEMVGEQVWDPLRAEWRETQQGDLFFVQVLLLHKKHS